MTTKAEVLAFLQNSPPRTTRRLIAGQMADYYDQGVFGRIQTATGRQPGLVGFPLGDFELFEGPSHWPAEQGRTAWSLNTGIAHWNAGGLPLISFVTSPPNTGEREDYLVAPGNIAAILANDPVCNPWVAGVHLSNQTFTSLLDRQLIGPLTTLKNAGVISLLRLWNEANSAFWWGTGGIGAANVIALQQLCIDYLTAAGLRDSVILVYSTIAGNNEQLIPYPGATYNDVVGFDYYSADGRFPPASDWTQLRTLGKPMAMVEIGLQTYASPYIPRDFNLAMADIEANYPDATFFQCWTSLASMEGELNLTQALARPWLATLPVFSATAGPTASFTATQQLGSLTVAFTDTSIGGPVAWLYTLYATDGTTVLTTVTAQNASYTYPAVGTYPASLRVTDAGGLTHTVNHSVVVGQPQVGFTFVRYQQVILGANLATAPITLAAVTAGDLVVVTVDASISASGSIALAGSFGTFTATAAEFSWDPGYGGFTARVRSFWVIATTTLTNTVVTATFTGGTTGTGGYCTMTAKEYALAGGVIATLIVEAHAVAVAGASPMTSGPVTAAANDALLGYNDFDQRRPTPPVGWVNRDAANFEDMDLLAPTAGAVSFAPTFGGTQNWVSQILQFRVTPAGSSQTLTATTRTFDATLYLTNLNLAGTTVLTATARAFTPTLYAANLVVQTQTLAGFIPIRVLRFKSGEQALIVIRATVKFAERAYYANVTARSLHPAAGANEVLALQSGELVEELVTLPNPKTIVTYTQLQALAEAAQLAFQARIDQVAYETMDGVDGNLTTFDGTDWS